MTRWAFVFASSMLLAIVGLTPSAAAQTGTAVEVTQPAVIRSNGATVTLAEGDLVRMGDIVATGETGRAQILFPDDTRIVVAPNSQLDIDRLLFRDTTTVRRMTLTAVRGSFRFLSGSSPKRAYRLKTPTATMGVRGTSFDVAVTDRNNTDLVVFTGAVQLCASGARCAIVPGGCQTVSVNQRGAFAQPANVGERNDRLRLFPLIRSQEALAARFRAATASCDDGGGSSASLAVPVRQIQLPQARASSEGGGGSGSGPAPSAPERRGNPAQ